MVWRKEFGLPWKIPQEVLDLVDRGLLEDRSWHNDMGPSFWRDLDRGLSVVLWVNHPQKAKREYVDERFLVQMVDREGGVGYPADIVATDDLGQALRAIDEAAAGVWKAR